MERLKIILTGLQESFLTLLNLNVQGVRQLLENPEEKQASVSWAGSAEEDPTYVLLLQCNQLAVDIDNEIVNIHNYMKDKYKAKFPELASFVHDAVQYAKTIQIIRNEMDLTKVQLEEVLPQVCSPLPSNSAAEAVIEHSVLSAVRS